MAKTTGCKCGGTLQKWGWRKKDGKQYRQYRCPRCKEFHVDYGDERCIAGAEVERGQLVAKGADGRAYPATPPLIHYAALEDGCMLSYQAESAPMSSSIRPGAVCALSLQVHCAGTVQAKRKCPLWSGTGKVI